MSNKVFTVKNVLNTLFIALMLVLLLVTDARAFLLRGLMTVGLFKPSLEAPAATPPMDRAAIAFKDASGKSVSLQELDGKVVFINFWATWCPPCIAEMPSMNKLYAQFKDDERVVFIFVDADSRLDKAQAFLKKKKYDLPVYQLVTNIPETLFSGSLPTTVVLDKQGVIRYKGVGAGNYADPKFIQLMEKLTKM